MSRYIDADAIDKAFSKLRFNNDGELEHYGDRPNWYLWGSEVENLIADAPSIDIVRCKECRWGKPYSDKQLECDALGLGGLKFPNDFCSYGVRKTNTTAKEKPTPIRDYMVHGEREGE